jgi:hypothetical protein
VSARAVASVPAGLCAADGTWRVTGGRRPSDGDYSSAVNNPFSDRPFIPPSWASHV